MVFGEFAAEIINRIADACQEDGGNVVWKKERGADGVMRRVIVIDGTDGKSLDLSQLYEKYLKEYNALMERAAGEAISVLRENKVADENIELEGKSCF